MDQRKRGAKPPFFRNNPQGQQMPKETRTIDIGSQGPRQPPMQCWGYKGDHRFRHCPQIGEKGRAIHNVQRAETVEDMGIYMPNLEDYEVLEYFEDVFKEVPGLPPRRDIDFSKNLMPGEAPVSKTPYIMSITELKELQM
jgi:hypothetical protein